MTDEFGFGSGNARLKVRLYIAHSGQQLGIENSRCGTLDGVLNNPCNQPLSCRAKCIDRCRRKVSRRAVCQHSILSGLANRLLVSSICQEADNILGLAYKQIKCPTKFGIPTPSRLRRHHFLSSPDGFSADSRISRRRVVRVRPLGNEIVTVALPDFATGANWPLSECRS